MKKVVHFEGQEVIVGELPNFSSETLAQCVHL